MAIIQISRIQVRRGQKNQGAGLPQLSSGELGWAIDTRELYIGNGSVSEGSPAVGNTKLLTEHDNIFSLSNTYTYKQGGSIQTGTSTVSPITRNLQSRLDDTVSVRSFGLLGDSSQDVTVALQRTIDQLFLNSSFSGEKSRVTLHMEPGIYVITNTIYLPPFVTIQGAGPEKTIIRQTGNYTMFATVNSSSTPGSYAANSGDTFNTQARDIRISGITLQHQGTGIGLDLQNCRDSIFTECDIIGNWNTGETIPSTYAANIGVRLSSISSAVGSNNNKFDRCKFGNWAFGILSNYDIEKNHISNSEFVENGHGVVLGVSMSLGAAGQLTGPKNTTISDSHFSNISRYGIWLENGQDTISRGNHFASVGNEGGNEGQPQYSIIKFAKDTNRSINDFFTRTENLSYDKHNLNIMTNTAYKPEIQGTYTAEFSQLHKLSFAAVSSPGNSLFRLPFDSKQTQKIKYHIVNTAASVAKTGTLTITSESGSSQTLSVSDDYDFAGSSGEDDIQFTASLHDYNSDSVNDTILIKVINLLGSTSDIQFTIENTKSS